MYLEHFQLTELPFRLSPDPAFLYLSKHHARAKAYMESTIWFTDGFVVITGEIGAGKTLLTRALVDAFAAGPDGQHEFPVFSMVLYIGAVVTGAWFVAPRAWYALRRLRPDMNLLMTIAVAGAMLIGDWLDESSMTILPAAAQQIAAAVLPLPAEMRAARVRRIHAVGTWAITDLKRE